MHIELQWVETVIILGALLIALGPERVNEFARDLRLLWNDVRALVLRRGK